MPTWQTYSTPSLGGQLINDMCCVGSGKFVAVGTGGLILSSGDGGQTWTVRTPPELNDFGAVAFDGTNIVAVAYTGTNRVAVSTDDGHTWTAHAAAEANSWASITYAAFLSMFVAVSNDGTHRVMTSLDGGATWSTQTASSVQAWGGVAASSSLLMAFTNSAVMTSPDGSTWTDVTAPTISVVVLQGSNVIVYLPSTGMFAVGGNGGTAAVISFSSDGSSWSDVGTSPLTTYFSFFGTVAADAIGGFVAGAPFDTAFSPTPTIILYSLDGGATWTDEDTTFSGTWAISAWDDSTNTVVFWDSTPSATMLVGTFPSAGLAITPNTGFTNGGLSVAITGGDGNFAVGTTVEFGRIFGAFVAATNVVVTDGTHLTCDTPAFPIAELVNVVITNPSDPTVPVGIFDAFTYVEPSTGGGPGSFSVSPNHGPVVGGTVVTLTANGFNWPASPRVAFGGAFATGVSGGGTTVLTCTTTAHFVGPVDVVVYSS